MSVLDWRGLSLPDNPEALKLKLKLKLRDELPLFGAQRIFTLPMR